MAIVGVAKSRWSGEWPDNWDVLPGEDDSKPLGPWTGKAVLRWILGEGFKNALSSSDGSDESYPLMIASQGLQTRRFPDWPKYAPSIKDVHLASNI